MTPVAGIGAFHIESEVTSSALRFVGAEGAAFNMFHKYCSRKFVQYVSSMSHHIKQTVDEARRAERESGPRARLQRSANGGTSSELTASMATRGAADLHHCRELCTHKLLSSLYYNNYIDELIPSSKKF